MTEATATSVDSESVIELTGVPGEAPWHAYVRRLHDGEATSTVPDDVEQLEISVATPRRPALSGIGRFENNLARKGVFDLKTVHCDQVGSSTEQKTDLVGKTTLTFTMGALGPLEMDLIAWTMGQWQRHTNEVSFTLREVGRSLGVSWKGQLGTSIKNSFLRIKAMTITGRVWDADQKKHTTLAFNIFDRVEIVEERSAEDGPATRPASVKVVLSEWIVRQLRAGQYSDFEWAGYRAKLTTPFARRLYLLLESQEGTDDGISWRVRVDETLGQTLGTNDATVNPSRFRANLRSSGKQICEAWSVVYRSIDVVNGTKRGEYYLEIHRTLKWREDRLARRRRALAEAAI